MWRDRDLRPGPRPVDAVKPSACATTASRERSILSKRDSSSPAPSWSARWCRGCCAKRCCPAGFRSLHPQHRGRQHRRGHHRLLDAAVDRDLSRNPPQLCDLPVGADRSRADHHVVRPHPLPLRPRRPGARLRAARHLALCALHLRRAAGAAALCHRPVRSHRAADSGSTESTGSPSPGRGSTTPGAATRSSPTSAPTFPTNGRPSSPTPRSPGGSSTRSSSCRNR